VEDAVTTSTPNAELSDATEQVVPFTKIAAAMARGTCQDAGAMRALVATVVAVGPDDRLTDAGATLRELGDAGTVRGILISPGSDPAPPARVSGNTVLLRGIKAPYLNNAVAALRLSSLPTLVWWRGGSGDLLEGLADLADRIVLDEVEPEGIWRRAVPYFADSAFSDLRWARLTQWRALMAHFFDIPEVRAAAREFTRLHIRASDRMSAQLFAAWLTSSIGFADRFAVDVDEEQATGANSVLGEVSLGNGEQALGISLAADPACLETSVSVRGHKSASRVVSLANPNLTALMTEELRIRARDVALERALRAFVGA
jgi:glucose-6-phosphate dehydrogenase assembly protein OpcA